MLSAGCGGRDEGEGGGGGDRPSVNIVQGEPERDGDLVKISTGALPGGLANSCEYPGHDRFLADAKHEFVPMGMYYAACDTNTATPKVYVSMTLVDDRPGEDEDPPMVGAIVEARLDPDTGALIRTGNDVVLDECDEAHGIAASDDCSRVAVLCRKYVADSDDGEFTKDLTLTLSEGSRDWVTQPTNEALIDANDNIPGSEKKDNYRTNGEMWLLEWNDTTLSESPDRYVVHKAIGDGARGNHTLHYEDGEDTYGMSLATAVFDGGGKRHVSDAFWVVDRDRWTIDEDRSWTWQCGVGHTLHNRVGYHPDTGRYVALCTTDWRNDDDLPGAGIWIKDEGRSHIVPGRELYVGYSYATRSNGGSHALIPIDGGRYLSLVVGLPWYPEEQPNADFMENLPTQVGLMTLGPDADGVSDTPAMQGPIAWIFDEDASYLGHPQLAPLGDDRYLVGYGELHHVGDPTNRVNNADYQVPWTYYLGEVDGQGNVLVEPRPLAGFGWGEQDQWLDLGQGRVAWAYISDPELDQAKPISPQSCSRDELVFGVYHGAS